MLHTLLTYQICIQIQYGISLDDSEKKPSEIKSGMWKGVL